MLVVELLSIMAQGVSYGGDEEGRRLRLFSLLLCFLSFLVSISQNKSSLFFNLPSLLSLYIRPLLWLLSSIGIYREKIGREVYYPYPVMAQG
jgi:uncharacterized protein with PQ loop repeat